jgi:pimeloyl-ACP methyl ester carboxylesterase
MLRAPVDGAELEYEVRGSGDPVLFVHGGLYADSFKPLLDRTELSGRYRLIHYHRVGYAGSSHVDGPVSIGRQAAHVQSLVHHLGNEPVHVVGHSSGANIALQLALDHPASVRSLTLLETALLAVPSGPFAGQAFRHYHIGDKAAAVDTWMRGVAGPDYRDALDRVVPGAFGQAVTDADTFFAQELPAVRDWSFGPPDADGIEQPVLAVLGARSNDVAPAFGRRHHLLLTWLPDVQPFVLPDATHLLHVHNPGGMAQRLARFLTDITATRRYWA